MHLLLAQPGSLTDGGEAVDLGQNPADLIVVSAADTELAALSAARAEMTDPPRMRLASLLHLSHPMSVDKYLDDTASKARLVVARILGGESYWSYGLEQFAARLGAAGVPFAALPGDDRPDAALTRASTVSEDDHAFLWSCLVEGGLENATRFLQCCRAIMAGTERPEPARPLLRAGLYWPGVGVSDLETIRSGWRDPNAPIAPIVFYRALVQGAGLNPINRLTRALTGEGLNPLPIFVASLKDPVSIATLARILAKAPPGIFLNTTSFSVSSPQSGGRETPLDAPGVPILQCVLASGTEEDWRKGFSGLSARDIAMNVALPEVDGRLLARAISFKGEAFFDEATQCRIATYRAEGTRIAFTARLAAAWTRLARKSPAGRKVAFVLANYPNRDGRLANGVGLDTPQSAVDALAALKGAGYAVRGAPETSADLMAAIQVGPTNRLAGRGARTGGARLSLESYRAFWSDLPWEVKQPVEERWGPPEDDPFFIADEGAFPLSSSGEKNGRATQKGGEFILSILTFGNVAVGIQPARGYNIDPAESCHSPDLVPPHNYFAFYAWIRREFGADAVVHFGKHGTLEWLPGKAVALSETCFSEAVFGPMPHLYPFIVNDPGEGTQAKRRAQAVILDHLTPPLTRAETYGPLKELEALVDEYYEAAGIDPRRLDHLRRQIRAAVSAAQLEDDAGITPDMNEQDTLIRLDTYLCELKEAQIRDGLHIFGTSPGGALERDLAIALLRVPRGDGKGANASLIRALAQDCGIDPEEWDPLDCEMGRPWDGPRHELLRDADDGAWRTAGDTVERLEKLAVLAVEWGQTPKRFAHTAPVLDNLRGEILPTLRACGEAEMRSLLTGLDGGFIPPGPSGAPTRGRPDTLPTGRNFYSVDGRAVPTPAAWALGWHSASLLVERFLQDHGDWPRTVALTAWGTSNMRTGGDDIAQALALMGARPQWDRASRRVTGFEIVSLDHLARPRVDVTLRVSGFFRDAFPAQIALIDKAARAVMALDEPDDMNPAAARFRAEGGDERAGFRVFGSKPGAYGAGLQAMIDERLWERESDLADAYLEWGGYAYGAGKEGLRERRLFETRLGQAQAVVQNQDNREHDLLDSDDYYQFEGGAAAAVKHLSGKAPAVYHNDHSRPERPAIRTLEDEIGRVVRSRVVNPKWLAGVRRHGYKGAFEIAAAVDYMFAFAATTGAVKSRHFDLVHEAVLETDDIRDFIAEANPAALREIAERMQEALDRGLWTPRLNSARARLESLLG